MVLGAFASAGDMVAITGIQVMLMLHIEAAYGRDPDVQRIWQLLPVIGGGFGWRTLARELSGFVPVAGIAIKGAIAYAGTIVVGEGVTFFHEHGSHMTKGQAAQLYERKRSDAMRIRARSARETFPPLREALRFAFHSRSSSDSSSRLLDPTARGRAPVRPVAPRSRGGAVP